MENIRHLIEVLKSQVQLYSDLLELISSEKEHVISWSSDKTMEINKRKEHLLHRERIQEEARKVLMAKISASSGVSNMNLAKVINLVQDDGDREALMGLGDKLLSLVTSIHAENLSLRMLYTSNNRLINDFLGQIGMSLNSSYSNKTAKVNTFKDLA